MRKPLKYPETLLDLLVSKTKETNLGSLKISLNQSLKNGVYKDIDLAVISVLVEQTIEETAISIPVINQIVKQGLLTDKEARAIIHRALQK